MRATGSIYGTTDAGRSWYIHFKNVMRKHGFHELRMELAVYQYRSKVDGKTACLAHSHVDDVLATWDDKYGKEVKAVLDKLVLALHMKRESPPFRYCGRDYAFDDEKITITQKGAALACQDIDLTKERKKQRASPVTEPERSLYRSLLGMLLWISQHTRPDLAVGVGQAATKTVAATVEDIVSLNHLAKYARDTAEVGIVFRRGVIDLRTAEVLGFGDSGFATGTDVKSRFGSIVGLTHQPKKVIEGHYELSVIFMFLSAVVRRVVRSTLAAEGYSISETQETAEWFRQFLQ